MKKILFAAFTVLFAFPVWAELTVYTDRSKDRYANAAKAFEAQTGEKIVFVEGATKDLLSKLETEGKQTPADLIIAKDLIFLNELSIKKLLQPMVKSAAVNTVDESMRDSNLNWVALTYRARSVAFDPSRDSASDFSTYEDLAGPNWKGRLCLRSSKGNYNEALTSYLIETHGIVKTESIIAGWLENLAAPVFASDNAVLEAIANGVCDVGIVNTYYLGQTLNKNPSFPVSMAFLEQQGNGVHTNGSGVAIVGASLKQNLAQQFVDILLTDAIQLEVSAAQFEYPAASHLLPNTLLKDWGKFKVSPTKWSDLSKWYSDARRIMDEAGYQ